MIPYRWMGLVSYQEGLDHQQRAVVRIRSERNSNHEEHGVILACEHPTIITLGVRADPSVDLLLPVQDLERHGAEVASVSRGGQATLHNPGQLVIYPILRVTRYFSGVRHYVEHLIETTQRYLLLRGVDSERRKEPGLWVNGHKIAAFGIRVSRGISSHGVAINICNDLTPFRWIRSCGQSSALVTSLASSLTPVPVAALQAEGQCWVDLFNSSLSHFVGVPDASPGSTPKSTVLSNFVTSHGTSKR
jgi:lipoyl(octanoyl) transferase